MYYKDIDLTFESLILLDIIIVVNQIRCEADSNLFNYVFSIHQLLRRIHSREIYPLVASTVDNLSTCASNDQRKYFCFNILINNVHNLGRLCWKFNNV